MPINHSFKKKFAKYFAWNKNNPYICTNKNAVTYQVTAFLLMDPNMEKYSDFDFVYYWISIVCKMGMKYASLDSLETKSVKLQHINKPWIPPYLEWLFIFQTMQCKKNTQPTKYKIS